MAKPDALTVMLVDDDEDLRAALKDFLQEKGFGVACYGRCGEARQALSDASFEVHMVLTDLKLPDGNGLDIVRAARERDHLIVAAVITGYASLETALKAIRLGAYDYLTKPFNFDEIEILVENMSDKVRLMAENRRVHERLDVLSRNLEDLSTIRVELARLNRVSQERFDEISRRLDQLLQQRN